MITCAKCLVRGRFLIHGLRPQGGTLTRAGEGLGEGQGGVGGAGSQAEGRGSPHILWGRDLWSSGARRKAPPTPTPAPAALPLPPLEFGLEGERQSWGETQLPRPSATRCRMWPRPRLLNWGLEAELYRCMALVASLKAGKFSMLKQCDLLGSDLEVAGPQAHPAPATHCRDRPTCPLSCLVSTTGLHPFLLLPPTVPRPHTPSHREGERLPTDLCLLIWCHLMGSPPVFPSRGPLRLNIHPWF